MKRRNHRHTDSELTKLFANPEVAVITGFAVVTGAALLVMLALTISAVGALVQQVAAGPM